MSGHLRVYFGPDDDRDVLVPKPDIGSKTVTIKLKDVFGALNDAKENQRVWLQDFAEEEITISTDLYEVILAYESYRRSSA